MVTAIISPVFLSAAMFQDNINPFRSRGDTIQVFPGKGEMPNAK
jgi:hypothetical protein